MLSKNHSPLNICSKKRYIESSQNWRRVSSLHVMTILLVLDRCNESLLDTHGRKRLFTSSTWGMKDDEEDNRIGRALVMTPSMFFTPSITYPPSLPLLTGVDDTSISDLSSRPLLFSKNFIRHQLFHNPSYITSHLPKSSQTEQSLLWIDGKPKSF